VYWAGAAKDKVTTKKLKTMVTEADLWFRTVSNGRIGHSAKVLGWAKIKKPGVQCGLSSQSAALTKAAEAFAKKKGVNPKKFDRVVIYVTSKACKGNPPEAGLGSTPGRYVWLNGSTEIGTFAHELGHNLGLNHANYGHCSAGSNRIALGTAKQCNFIEYGDSVDMMGAFSKNGWFSGPRLEDLGWVTKAQKKSNTSGSKASYTLVPLASAKSGVKVVKVKASKTRTYWLEYRTRTGLDKGLAAEGVQVRVTDKKLDLAWGYTGVLDMFPTAGNKNIDWQLEEWEDTFLRPGSSWTSPEGIQVVFDKVSSGKAKITVKRKQKASKPAAPTKVTAQNADGALSVTWARPADKGSPIRSYTITASSSSGHKVTKKIASAGGTVTKATVSGLKNGQTYTVAVAAVNEKGSSAAGRSAATKVEAVKPRLDWVSPAAGTAVSGKVKVELVPRKGTSASKALDTVTICLDQAMEAACQCFDQWSGAVKDGKTIVATLDSTEAWQVPDGAAKIWVEVRDEAGRSAKFSRAITLQRSPVVSVGTVPSLLVEGSTVTVMRTLRAGGTDDYGNLVATVRYAHPQLGAQELTWYPSVNEARTSFVFAWDFMMRQYADVQADVAATVTFTYTGTFYPESAPLTVTRSTTVRLPAAP